MSTSKKQNGTITGETTGQVTKKSGKGNSHGLISEVSTYFTVKPGHEEDWIDQHPQAGNPNCPLICGLGKKLGKRLTTPTLYRIYKNYREKVFPKLLDNPSISPEDKQKIKGAFKKALESLHKETFCAYRKIYHT